MSDRDEITDELLDIALHWHIKLQPSEVPAKTSAEFAAWLKQDDRHNKAYDIVTQSDSDLEEWAKFERANDSIEEPTAANDDRPFVRWLCYGGLGVAASILLVIFLWPQMSATQFRTIATDPGETQVVELKDGSRVHVNGDSEIKLKADESRYAEVLRGEAIFYVKHDAGDPFAVFSGGYELIDRGTIFNVKQEEGAISVGVSEGAVLLKGQQKLVDIQAGKILTINKDGEAKLKSTTLSNVGSWTRGQLVYDLVPISSVITDINRGTKLNLSIDPEAAKMQFSGTIQLQDNPDQMIVDLEKLLGLKAADTDTGWHLTR